MMIGQNPQAELSEDSKNTKDSSRPVGRFRLVTNPHHQTRNTPGKVSENVFLSMKPLTHLFQFGKENHYT
jgi:hypothetical protein